MRQRRVEASGTDTGANNGTGTNRIADEIAACPIGFFDPHKIYGESGKSACWWRFANGSQQRERNEFRDVKNKYQRG